MEGLTKALYAAGLAGLCALLSGCSAKHSAVVAPIGGGRSFSAVAGVAVYTQHCLSCHGAFDTSAVRDKTYEEIVSALGRSPMDSLHTKLTEADLRNLAYALRTDIDNVAPKDPTGLQATVLGPTGVALQWNAVEDNAGGSGLASYHVFRDGALVATVDGAALNHSDLLLTASTTYAYQLQAEDKMGNLTEKTAAVSATTSSVAAGPDKTAPPTPTGLAGIAKSPSRIEVRWQAASDESGGSGLKGYRLYRNDVYVTDLPPSALLYLDTNLGANAPYKYQVTAQDNANNESAKGAGITVSTQTVNAAVLYGARCQSCHGALATSELRGQTAAQIAAAIRTVAPMSVLTDLGTAELAALETYLALQADVTAPSVPTQLTATVSSFSQINLSWGPSTDTGGSGVSGYRVYRGAALIATVGASVLVHPDTGLTAKTAYSYQVEAIDAAGNVSAKTATATATTMTQPAAPDTTAPAAPAAPLGTVLSATRLKVRWTAAADNAGGSGISGYRVRRNGTQIAELGAATVEYLDTDLPDGTTFSYTLVAVDNANNASPPSAALSLSTPVANGTTLYANRCASCHQPLATSAKKNRSASAIGDAIRGVATMSTLSDLGTDEIAAIATVLAPAPDTTVPSVPGALQGAAASTSRINLTWGASTDTGGAGLKSYQLYVGTTLLTTVNAPATSYSHTGLSANTPYAYKVRAVDNANNASAFSAVLTVTTPATAPPPDTTAPNVPTGLTATPASTSVALAWTAATDNAGGSGVVSYKLYRNTVFFMNVNAPALTASDAGRLSSTQYSYQVSSVDGAGNESAKSVAKATTTLPPDGQSVYAAKCASCHGTLGTSNLKNRYGTTALFSTAFTNAIRPVANGGIPEMQGRTLTAAELSAIGALLAGEDADPGGGDDGVFQSSLPTGTRTYLASVLRAVFVNSTAPTASDTSLNALIETVIVKNPELGGPCTRYDGPSCPAVNVAFHNAYLQAAPRPRLSVSRAGTLLHICSQVLTVGVAAPNALAGASLTTSSPADDANLRKVYALFFPFRTAESGVISNLSALHAQSLSQGMSGSEAWRLVLMPLCESALGGGL